MGIEKIMNRSQVKKLKDGDMIRFKTAFPPFTVGKRYWVKDTGDMGMWVCDDSNDRWWPLGGPDDLCQRFEAPECKT